MECARLFLRLLYTKACALSEQTAVSYTHLYDDVKVGDTVTLDYRAGMRSEYKPEEFVVSGILSVSYTHLDVYKRQVCISIFKE